MKRAFCGVVRDRPYLMIEEQARNNRLGETVRATRIFPVSRLREWQICYFAGGLAGEGRPTKMESNQQESPGDRHGPATSQTRVAPLRHR